ncbi:MAG TPA: MraY family glycosyltransferase, partial [Blastocatellia bacterium]|nr:MraY family glycosyltransferase [Blastocatellia bacterium]
MPATLMFLFGVYDDFRGADAKLKLLVQTIAAALLYFYGFGIHNLSLPFGDNFVLPIWLSFPATWLWVIGITNAFNLIDGIDGLAAGASGFAMLSIFLSSLAQGNQEICVLAVILIGAVIGFLHYNFHPATIFMGDSGSLFLGFMAAALSLAGSSKGTTVVAIAIPLISFGLPIVEVGVSIVRRFISGHGVLRGDRAHIHHKLLERGFSQRQVVILLYAVCASFSLFGLLLLNPARSLAAGIFIVIAVGIIFGVRHLKYPEFAELESQLKDGVKKRRRRLMINARLRQAGAEMAQAQDGEQLFEILARSLEMNDFEGVALELNGLNESQKAVGDHLFKRCTTSIANNQWQAVENANGYVAWCWQRNGQCIEKMCESDSYWQLRLPLLSEGQRLGTVTFYQDLSSGEPVIDLRNLCGSFQ